MKIRDITGDFNIYISNQEVEVINKIKGLMRLGSFTERDQEIIKILVRKNILAKTVGHGIEYIYRSDL